ncbi:MAG: YggS family pyridoxal phosphate-dependent enzyme [Melioribacteraceae bacterium]|nr:YggS family pyridoxal phosphate-dependent enzyme [Melioribacteraceae bacterium]
MINENHSYIEKEISAACEKHNINRSKINLVAVSKYNPVSSIIEAYEDGLIHFGESRAQELKDKAEQISLDIQWHFIGHLQTNKVKIVVENSDFIHSVDSIKLAAEIQKRAANIDKIQNIFIEVKTSGEDSKFGVSEFKDAYELADYCTEAKNIEVIGLMTMAPYTDDEKVIRNCFSTLRNLKDQLNKKNSSITELSMGMTNDFKIAIEEGATYLRIGSAIFGERNY